MQKSVGVVSTRGRVPGACFRSTSSLLGVVGQNTGNLVFQYAVSELITDPKVHIDEDITWDVGLVRERCRVLVVPSANFIRDDFDITDFVNFLEATDLPLVFLGLGAQADSFSQREFDLHPSIRRLLSLAQERSVSIGVRGNYTAEILSDMGITNVKVIGCPSNHLNPDADLPRKLAAKWNADVVALATNGDEPWPRSQLKLLAEQRLVDWAWRQRGPYVQQSVEPFVRLIRNGNPYQTDAVNAESSLSLRLSIAPRMSADDFRRFCAASVRLYTDVDQWLEDMARFDLSIGLRLHGNMVPMQAGCPSIWIHHDARTRELIDTMMLPSLSLEEFLMCRDVEEAKSRANVDFEAYGRRRAELRARIATVFEEHGLTLRAQA